MLNMVNGMISLSAENFKYSNCIVIIKLYVIPYIYVCVCACIWCSELNFVIRPWTFIDIAHLQLLTWGALLSRSEDIQNDHLLDKHQKHSCVKPSCCNRHLIITLSWISLSRSAQFHCSCNLMLSEHTGMYDANFYSDFKSFPASWIIQRVYKCGICPCAMW